jgi:L-2,4-diaminobutyrate decarboxylase
MKDYPLLQKAYNFDDFEQSGQHLIEQLSGYLQGQQLAESPANNWQAPDKELIFWQNYQFKDINSFVDDLLNHSIHVHNPKYMGHQVAVSAPLAVLSNLISGLLNNGMAVYEMGQAATTIEKCIVDLFCQKIGYGEMASGVMTSGGTLASLTALLAARQALKDSDIWRDGNHDKLAVLVSSQAHYCIDRAARIMGLGSNGVVLIPVNSGFSMENMALEKCYLDTVNAGFKVIAIVGSACSTSTGIYDDLEYIADFCHKNKVWFHVDGAHGGAVVFSEKHMDLVKGIEKADSVIIDTHKMLMTPALSTVLAFKDKNLGAQTFHQKANYLFEDNQFDDQWFNAGLRTFECTKLMMCLKFYILWKTYGIKVFEENIDCLYGLGETFANRVDHHSCFELALAPQTNIVCFRYIKQELTEDQTNQLNKSIRQTLLEDNDFYIVQAVLGDTVYLRVTLMNPMTEEVHINQLLDKIQWIVRNL